MKTVTLLLLFLAINSACMAQEVSAVPNDAEVIVNKRGRPILPQKGDFSIGLDASPFFQYVGNMFNNTANNAAPVLRSPLSPSLIAKYMKSATTAIRVRFALNNLSSEGNNLVDNSYSPDPNAFVKDTKSYGSTNILVGMGLEKRRGNGRLLGIYGIEAFVGFTSSSSTLTYGNAITAAMPSVAFTLWNTNSATVSGTTFGSTRMLETSTGTSVSFGITGFVGAEYFIAPKISIGGELGYSISSVGAGTGKQRTESFDFTSNTVTKTTTDFFATPSTFSFGTVPTGTIFLNLYF